MNKYLSLEIIQDKQAEKYYIMDINNQKKEIESFLDYSLITYPQNLCTTLLYEIFKQPEGEIQDYLDRLSQVIAILNDALKQNGIAF